MDALIHYSEFTGERVTFDAPEDAAQLEPAGDAKGYTGRSTTPVRLCGEMVGDLVVVAFAPLDGTGSCEDYKPGDLKIPTFPDVARYYPHSKSAVHSEAHLTIASKEIDTDTDPIIYAGHLAILGVEDGKIAKIGYVGQAPKPFAASLADGRSVLPPSATLTTGYRGVLRDGSREGERFADPHAIVNLDIDHPSVQLAAFLAITKKAGARSLNALRHLNAREPFLGKF